MSVAEKGASLLKDLAVALVENPRASIKELGDAVGRSRATIHRQWGTREELEKAIFDHAKTAVRQICEVASGPITDHRSTLRQLIELHFEHKEVLRAMTLWDSCLEAESWQPYADAMDAFFLGGQKAEVFRFDVSAQALSEAFMSLLCGMIDAVRRGRVAPQGVTPLLEGLFLLGALKPNK